MTNQGLILVSLLLYSLPVAAQDDRRADRYAYSALLCAKRRMLKDGLRYMAYLRHPPKVATFEGQPVYGRSRESISAEIQRHTDALAHVQQLIQGYSGELARRGLTPVKCSASELDAILLCRFRPFGAGCDQSPLAETVRRVDALYQIEESNQYSWRRADTRAPSNASVGSEIDEVTTRESAR